MLSLCSTVRRPRTLREKIHKLIAAELLKNLRVSNDARSMLIRISYTSTSPEQSARIANAFAEEYLRTRIGLAARRRLTNLSATYGPKHPIVLKAKSDLEEVLRAPRLSVSERAQILSWASPPILPSGPDWKLIVGVAFICSFAAGIVLVLLLEQATQVLEQAKQVFRSAAETDQERIAQTSDLHNIGVSPIQEKGAWMKKNTITKKQLVHVPGMRSTSDRNTAILIRIFQQTIQNNSRGVRRCH